MDLQISLDVLFLILALLVLPSCRFLPAHDDVPPPSADTPRFLVVPTQSTHSTPADSPHPSPGFVSLAVPSITLTPDRPDLPNPSVRPSHKRKSVSFSISSIDGLQPDSRIEHRKRPPTPYIAAPISPGSILHRSGTSMPGSPTELSHSRGVIDPMGVQKSWLMG